MKSIKKQLNFCLDSSLFKCTLSHYEEDFKEDKNNYTANKVKNG